MYSLEIKNADLKPSQDSIDQQFSLHFSLLNSSLSLRPKESGTLKFSSALYESDLNIILYDKSTIIASGIIPVNSLSERVIGGEFVKTLKLSSSLGFTKNYILRLIGSIKQYRPNSVQKNKKPGNSSISPIRNPIRCSFLKKKYAADDNMTQSTQLSKKIKKKIDDIRIRDEGKSKESIEEYKGERSKSEESSRGCNLIIEYEDNEGNNRVFIENAVEDQQRNLAVGLFYLYKALNGKRKEALKLLSSLDGLKAIENEFSGDFYKKKCFLLGECEDMKRKKLEIQEDMKKIDENVQEIVEKIKRSQEELKEVEIAYEKLSEINENLLGEEKANPYNRALCKSLYQIQKENEQILEKISLFLTLPRQTSLEQRKSQFFNENVSLHQELNRKSYALETLQYENLQLSNEILSLETELLSSQDLSDSFSDYLTEEPEEIPISLETIQQENIQNIKNSENLYEKFIESIGKTKNLTSVMSVDYRKKKLEYEKGLEYLQELNKANENAKELIEKDKKMEIADINVIFDKADKEIKIKNIVVNELRLLGDLALESLGNWIEEDRVYYALVTRMKELENNE
ncbi:hypothetical protein SteCoe_2624 [Stentor coeruleus]|uniref:Uncharacterized protein n=1 Tax=Stentor coeruleus TaxID=5963 RepID=A0A1R2CZ56_9CILI|nr:hypothetical protein SteCoe_2624 [Stentor coeruleus]